MDTVWLQLRGRGRYEAQWAGVSLSVVVSNGFGYVIVVVTYGDLGRMALDVGSIVVSRRSLCRVMSELTVQTKRSGSDAPS